MEKIWFKRKLYCWGWTFGTWESFVVIAIYIVANIYIFHMIDLGSHSGSDTLINFVPRFLLLTAILYFICWWKGERPRWQWGKRIEDEIDVLLRGGIVVMPTDTTYGIVGSALNEKVVNQIYALRKRDLSKSLIVLIGSRKDLAQFGVKPTEAQNKILDKVWPKTISSDEIVRPTDSDRFRPGPTSVVLQCSIEKFAYLHRGMKTIAFRLPAKRELRTLLRYTGPLVAPSTNPQGHPVAKTLDEARAYFGHHVDFYKDGGIISAPPSRLIDITGGTEKILR